MKRFLNSALKLLVSLGLTLYLAHSMNWRELSAVFSDARPQLFGAAVLFFVLSNGLGAAQWHLLLRAQDIAISFRQSLVFYFVGVFFNNVLLGNIGGDALRIYDIRRLVGHGSGGAAATFVDRFIGLFSSCTLALAVYPLIAATPGTELVSVLLPVWLALLVLLAMGFSRRIGVLFERLAFRLLPARLSELLAELRRSFVVYRHRILLLLGVWLISLGVQFCRILVYFCAGRAVGLEAELVYFICFQPVAAVVAALPISIGGLGVRENTLVGLFSSVGTAVEVSAAMSLTGYIAGLIASLLGGISFVLRRVEARTESTANVEPGTGQ